MHRAAEQLRAHVTGYWVDRAVGGAGGRVYDTPFGHRRYTCRDPQGHEWAFAEIVAPS